MFDQQHYVPILKPKAGEIWALKTLRLPWRSQMTPVFEIHKPTKRKDQPLKPFGQHIKDVCESIKQAWGLSNLFFLDTELINPMQGAEAAITKCLNACRSIGLKAIPVVKINYDQRSLDAVREAVRVDERGCMLRVDSEDVGAQVAIEGVLECLGLRKSQVHFLIDYREHAMSLAKDVARVISVADWITLTSASGAFPKTISTLPQRTWIDLPRHDWNTWKLSLKSGNLPRKPTFSDYASRCPGKPAAGGDPHVHLRYTKESKWLVYLDGTVQDGMAKNMPNICRSLVACGDYDGCTFSQGDREIHNTAFQGDAPEEKSGGATQWVQWCVNHHLTFVANQLKNCEL